jgi:DNA-binding NarL/FixJ family response regulator
LKISVVIAEDHTVVREGLRAILHSAGDVEVVGEAENGREAVRLASQKQPDVILLDLMMPLLNGFEATKQITREAPKTRILMLSSYSDPDRVQELLDMGIAGYLVKQSAADELVQAIREVRRGQRYLSPSLAKALAPPRSRVTSGARVITEREHLTPRELEVLHLIAEGYANKQIADQLKISIKTVEKHRQAVMDKLNIHEIAGLTRYAITKHMVEPTATPTPIEVASH